MDLPGIRMLIEDDLRAIDQTIRDRLASNVALINQISEYIIASGGKRLRPMLVALAARACGYAGQQHIELAAVIEFIHTATLLHDDVVDGSDLRRGNDTANAIWGNEASVLVGDFLYSRAFEMMVDVQSMHIMEILSHATNTIAEGEVLQLLNCHDPDTTEEQYLEVIRRKTAKLFEAGAQIGAVLAGNRPEVEQALAVYGMHLGTAFQVIDDVLDYNATSADIGKNIGDDLAEGKPTLPVIYAMRTGSQAQRQLIRRAIENRGREYITSVVEAIESTRAMSYSYKIAQREAALAVTALQALGNSRYKEALVALADFSIHRKY